MEEVIHFRCNQCGYEATVAQCASLLFSMWCVRCNRPMYLMSHQEVVDAQAVEDPQLPMPPKPED